METEVQYGDYRIKIIDKDGMIRLDIGSALMTIEEVEGYAKHAGSNDWARCLEEAAKVARQMEGES